ncbi:MAG: hypothetical protein QM755_00640 [Luteolibacter sp.]
MPSAPSKRPGRRRSPFFGFGLVVACVLVLGWWSSWQRPMSLGWLGNPRGDGYLARGSVILDLTWERNAKWAVREPGAAPLAPDRDGLDDDSYQEEARWWKITGRPLPDLPDGYHILIGIPAVLLLHLIGWLGVETWWRNRQRARSIPDAIV